jgi:hypothetical protein
MLAMYKQNSDASSSARYLLYSDDGGTTWSYKTIEAAGATYRNETDLLALSSTVLLAVTRDESTLEWYQSMSTDNGDTWTNQGALTFGESLTGAGPVRLHKFQISSTDVVVCYYPDRVNRVFKAAYTKSSTLISSGLSAWSAANRVALHQGTGKHLHYGDVCHVDGDFKAIGQYVIDPFPVSGSGTENVMYTFDIPSFHYPFIKSLLGL